MSSMLRYSTDRLYQEADHITLAVIDIGISVRVYSIDKAPKGDGSEWPFLCRMYYIQNVSNIVISH